MAILYYTDGQNGVTEGPMAERPIRKVLFVIGTLSQGGAEQQMVMLIEQFVRRGIDCSIFVLDGSGVLRPRLEATGIAIHAMNYQARTNQVTRLATLVAGLFKLWWLALRWRPDVLQAYLPLTNFMGAFAGRLAFVPLVVTSRRGLGTHQDRHPFWYPLDRLANALSTVVTCNSGAVAEDTVARDHLSRSKIALIRNGVDFSRFDHVAERAAEVRKSLRLGEPTLAIVTVANLIGYKGHADLLEAIAVLKSAPGALKFFLVGRDDDIGAVLARKANDLGISDHIVFLGARNDVPQLLAAMDVFVLPSHEEGSSNALLEAMVAGLPIIATDVGGNSEALNAGKYGMIVPAKNPAALAAAIRTVTSSMDTARQTGALASRYVQSAYSVDNHAMSHLDMYRARL